MENRIITISRQFGSGGRTIGKEVANQLNIKCYDAQIIEEVAKASGYAETFIKENSEYTTYSSFLGQILSARDYQGKTPADQIWIIQKKIIEDIAKKESCVIVGRCADYILKDKNILKVFIHSSLDNRAKRIVEKYGETDKDPIARLKDKDKKRSSYYEFYTDIKWGDATNYDIALDSGTLGLDKCVEIIKSLY